MDEPAGQGKIRFNRLLPYWAVLQTDLRQTARSWVYRLWVLMTLVAAGGSILYKVGLHREAGIVHSASAQSGHLLRGLIAGSVGLVALLAVSSVSAERATVADAILSRGISRRQYFLAKWHSRLVAIVVTFVGLAATVLVAHHFAFDPDLTLTGGLSAILIVAAGLAVIVSWGVTVGALANGTVIGITLFWLLLYGVFITLSVLPDSYPTPDRLMERLRVVLRGEYEKGMLVQVLGGAAGLSCAAALVGVVGFSRKDV